MFQKWVLFVSEVVTAACRKDVYLLCLSKKAIPTSCAGEAVARRRGTEKHWETSTALFFFFSHGLKAEKACEWTLADYPLLPWLIVGQTSSNHVLLCCVSKSALSASQEMLHFVAVQENGATEGRFNIQGQSCSCERALIKPERPSEQTGQSLAAKRANPWAEMSLSIAEMATGSIARHSWELDIFSLSIPVKSKVKYWQGTATNRSWVYREGVLNTPSQCNKPLWAH